MTIEEQIVVFEHNAEHERKEGDLNNCLNFRQLAEWLKELKANREAWEKVESEIDRRILEPWENHIRDDYFDGLCTAREIAKNFRPKEVEQNDR